MVDANITKQDLLKTVERLTKEIVQCQTQWKLAAPATALQSTTQNGSESFRQT
jgi:hypothetical protein